MQYDVVIIGAGPAGLTAAYELTQANRKVFVIEMDPKYVGGISRTETYKGFHFDIGGHRFFSKSKEVEDFWTKILGSKMLVRPRSSRIFYRKKFFSYPLRAAEALFKLGVVETSVCLLSYLKIKIWPIKNASNFEDWVSNQFGPRLFQIFFKTYTEKVWGMSCKEISSDWAAQRIKGLSLGSAIANALLPNFLIRRGRVIKTLIESFRYPECGPGMMWEKVAEESIRMGGELRLGFKVTKLLYKAPERCWEVNAQNRDGQSLSVQATHVISSAPLRELVASIEPKLESQSVANKLRYRDFLTVALVVKDLGKFEDNWVYIHDPLVKVGRVQNFKSWSPHMVPDKSLNCYGLEYFCHQGDELWELPDEKLLELAKKELIYLGLAEDQQIFDGHVVRQEKAYPVYDRDYLEHVEIIKEELQRRFANIHLVGRNGMHKYNNQDHAMMTAMLTAKNILAGQQIYDVWQVNQDAEYQEVIDWKDSPTSGLRSVPTAKAG